MPTDTRHRLIDTAFALFSEHGFHTIGLNRVLDAVGVSKQTFYNHFESKDDLILAVLEKREQIESAQFSEQLREHGGADPRAQLYALFDVLGAWFTEEAFRGCIFINASAEFPSSTDPAHRAAAAHVKKVERTLLEIATAAGADDPADLAKQLMVLMQGAIITRHITGNEDAGTTAGAIAKVLLDRALPVTTDVEVTAASRA